MNKTKQIYYSNWSDVLKPKHKSYWNDISNIAYLIALALEDRKMQSTILVTQHKEKYGGVRVYCALGCKLDKEKKNKKEYQKERVLHDAKHYRHVYMMAIELWPHYRDAIIESADFSELLFETKKEFDEACQDKINGQYYISEKDFVYEVCNWV